MNQDLSMLKLADNIIKEDQEITAVKAEFPDHLDESKEEVSKVTDKWEEVNEPLFDALRKADVPVFNDHLFVSVDEYTEKSFKEIESDVKSQLKEDGFKENNVVVRDISEGDSKIGIDANLLINVDTKSVSIEDVVNSVEKVDQIRNDTAEITSVNSSFAPDMATPQQATDYIAQRKEDRSMDVEESSLSM